MQRFLLTVVLAMGTVQAVPQSGTGTIQGTVRRADTGEPIADVTIQISAIGNMPSGTAALFEALPPGTQLTPSLLDAINSIPRDSAPAQPAVPRQVTATSPPPAPLGAITDAAGHFSIPNVAVGQYALTARKDGYVGPPEGVSPAAASLTTAPIPVAEGKTAPEVSLVMIPAGTISGRIRGPDGIPLSDATVAAYQYTYVEGGRAVLTSRVSKPTDDRGEFRLFWLPAGDYIVGAVPRILASAPNTQGRLARTYLPDTLDSTAAQPIAVKPGQAVSDLDIHVRTGNAMKVSGRVVSLLPSSPMPAPTQFFLIPRDARVFIDSLPATFQNFAEDKSNGQFELRNVATGSYELITSIPDSAGRSIPGRTFIDVASADVQGITLTVHPGVEVRARILYAGGAAPANVANIRPQIRAKEIFAQPFDGTPGSPSLTGSDVLSLLRVLTPNRPPSPTVDETGATVFPDVAEATYTFVLTGLPGDAYVSDIRKGGSSIFDSGLRVGATPPDEVQIVVTVGDTTAAGSVQDAAQKPVGFAKVVLVPEESRRGNMALYRWTSTNAAGQFLLHNVPAGNYKVFAWKYAPPNHAWENGEFISKAESSGVAVTVAGSSISNLKVPVIP